MPKIHKEFLCIKLAPMVQEKQSFSAQKDTLVLLVQEIGDTK